ncbi:MAG: type II toxin-antitoxin system YafQ family toxin [Lachnospiraceae bacterium]|jgi:mRNA interferase YafQ|nr:type II toxin-antitoxin system YafQ family toxin [Lachnospiraceae bacterium]
MIKEIKRTSQFKKDYKKAIKSGCKEEDFREVLEYLVEQKPLPEKYYDHKLADSRDYKNVRECHIYPDWLLVYRIYKEALILELVRTGPHSELFRK